MINVTKAFLPPFEEYTSILKRAWDSGWITNNGSLLLELESKLKELIGSKHLYFCGNGTVVLQMAIRALGITKEVITTPYSYVATTGVILWENSQPVFVDINDRDFNIDVEKIEASITENTEAILATHVYGNPCDVDAINKIAAKHNLKVIYDAAHAFNVNYKGKSLFNYGDIATCSLHATKLFHSVEGGLLITNDETISKKLMLFRQFGHIYDDHYSIGINGKNSEFHAAMGLAVLPYVSDLVAKRKILSERYKINFKGYKFQFPVPLPETTMNYAYFPVVFESEEIALRVMKSLSIKKINARRYFYPSLNELPYLTTKQICPISERISRCVLSLPLYPDLSIEEVDQISQIIKETIN